MFITLLFFISAANKLEIELIFRKLSDTLIPFYKNETQDIFEQMEQKIKFNEMNIQYQHECFSDYNYLGALLEINDPQLQFLVLASGCVIQHNSEFDQIQQGFIQLEQNQSEYKNGYFIKPIDDGIVLIAFRTFFHSSFIFHQCKFDGFSNQCIKGNNDHILKLGASCNTHYKNAFCDEEYPDPYQYYWLIWEQIKGAYHPGWFIFIYYYCKRVSRLSEDSQKRISLILSAILFLVVTNWQFMMIISIWKFVQHHMLANKFNFVEKLILYGTFIQIYANLIISSENVQFSKETAELLIFVYIAMLGLQISSIIFSKISIVILLYLVNYYVIYLKAMIELNTLVDNDFKCGMVYLNLVIGNLQELNAYTLVKFKHQILQILLEMEINYFPYLLSLFLLLIALYRGHKQLKRKALKFKYIVECFCQMQMSLLYLPLTILSTIFNIQEYQESCENFYLFWIYFFYFPRDFPFVSLILSFALIFFNNGETFTFIYKEIMKMSKMFKLEDLTKSKLKEDFISLLF